MSLTGPNPNPTFDYMAGATSLFRISPSSNPKPVFFFPAADLDSSLDGGKLCACSAPNNLTHFLDDDG